MVRAQDDSKAKPLEAWEEAGQGRGVAIRVLGSGAPPPHSPRVQELSSRHHLHLQRGLARPELPTLCSGPAFAVTQRSQFQMLSTVC